MKIHTLDPITLNDVRDLQNAPFVMEGEGSSAMKIYFESEQNKQEFLGTPLHGSDGKSGAGLKNIFEIADNPNTGLSY